MLKLYRRERSRKKGEVPDSRFPGEQGKRAVGMGGGNAQKSAMKRQRNQEKAKASAGGVSQLKQNSAALNIKCMVCLAVSDMTLRLLFCCCVVE